MTDAHTQQRSVSLLANYWAFATGAKVKHWCIVLSILMFCLQPLMAQNTEIAATTPTDMYVCAENATMYIGVKNISGGNLSSVSFDIDFPTGVSYVAGSLSEQTSFSVAESNITNLNDITLSCGNLANNDSVTFSIQMNAGCAARTAAIGGTNFEINIDANHNLGADNHTTNTYNMLYASLSITNVDAQVTNSSTGATFTRTVTITNGGNGSLSTFFLADDHNANIRLDSVSVGTITSVGDTIHLSNSDFSGIGDGDNLFDRNEIISIIEYFTVVGCNNSTSTLTAGWGCEGDYCQSYNTTAYAIVSAVTPSLAVTTTPLFNTCLDTSLANQQQISITNNGAAPAMGVEVDIYQHSGGAYDNSVASRIDENSVEYKVGAGSWQTATVTQSFATSTSGAYACLGANAKGRVLVDLPDIAAGETVLIRFNTYSCCITTCGDPDVNGWATTVTYDNPCDLGNTITASSNGQDPPTSSFSFFVESESDIFNGQTKEFLFIISSGSLNYPQGTGAHVELEFDLPDGLVWDGDSADLVFYSGTTVWEPMEASSSGGVLTAKYPMPIPFNLTRSEISLQLRLDCSQPGAADGMATVSLDVNYVMDTTCTNDCVISMHCNEDVSIYLHCPGACADGGMVVDGFTIKRTSFGQPDNDQDGDADGSGSLNMNLVKDNRGMVGDTIRSTHIGRVATTGTNPSWAYGYATSSIPLGENLTVVGGSIRIWDSSATAYITCNSVTVTSGTVGSTRNVTMDFSPSTLNANGCTALSGFTFGEGDSVWLYTDYYVTGNIGADVQQVLLTNEYYLSNTASPGPSEQYQCNNYGGTFTFVGYQFSIAGSSNATAYGCSRTISKNWYLTIGNCCTNYAGGNLFPYEYRNWGLLNEIKVTVPTGYSYSSSSLTHYRTEHTNSTITESISSLTVDQTNNDTLVFDISQHYGSSLDLGDDGFNGSMSITFIPDCDEAESTYRDVDWMITFEESDFLSGTTTSTYTATDQIQYSPPSIDMSTIIQVVDGLTQNIYWDFTIQNNSGGSTADNVWLSLASISTDVTVNEVEDLGSSTTITPVNDIYQLGSFSSGASKDYRIYATYTSCDLDSLTIYSGFNCVSYPSTFASNTCPYNTANLYVEPKDPEAQITTTGPTGWAGACNNEMEFNAEITSVQLASIFDTELDLIMPGSYLSFKSASATLRYPEGDSYTVIADPAQNGSTYTFDFGSYRPALNNASGFPGVGETDSNQINLTFTLLSDTTYLFNVPFTIRVRGDKACGEPMDTVSYSYPLYYDSESYFISIDKIDPSDVTDDLSNNWSVSWGDYNNDNDPDILLTNYDINERNLFYENNGDGTFTQKTKTISNNGNRGPAISAAWGDFNNDNRLDVVMANNIGEEIHLYQKKSGSNFTKMGGGDLAGATNYAHSATWGDYDNDGLIDLFVSDYMPSRYNALYRNAGSGLFEKVEATSLSLEARYSVQASWSDFDLDGDLDLFVPNANHDNNSLYRNDGAGTFTPITGVDIVSNGGNSVGSSWGDYDNDGDLDLFVANAGSLEANFLYRNEGDGSFTRITSGAILSDTARSHGSAWIDFNNDGWLDLFVVNDLGQDNLLYQNDGDGTFTKVVHEICDELPGNTMATAWSDYDNDGDLDVMVTTHGNNANYLYMNHKGICNNSGCIKLVGNISNKSGIGAKIRVKANINGSDIWQVREVSAQTGFGGQNDMRAHFGLGDATVMDSVVVEWPSGYKQVLTSQSYGDCITVTEPNGSKVCGVAYNDKNGNCVQDQDEIGLSNVVIEITPGPYYAITDSAGNYELYLTDGTYTLAAISPENWTRTCPTGDGTNSQVVSGLGNTYCGNDFGFEADCVFPDLSIDLGHTAFRKGLQNNVAIMYDNTGTQNAEDVEIAVTVDPGIIFLSATLDWDTLIGNTYYWTIPSIAVNGEGIIYVVDSISNSLNLEDTISISATIDDLDLNDCDTENSAQLSDEVVGAIDPNDKLTLHHHSGEDRYVNNNQKMSYKIRFQNVGTAAVSDVVIIDTLSEHLDMTTLELGAASHPYTFEILGSDVLQWTFNRINLPDSNSNEPASHGFVQFRINILPDRDLGTRIENNAEIIFDNEAAVMTNTVFNTVGVPLVVSGNPGSVTVWPNPAATFFHLELFGEYGNDEATSSITIHECVLYDLHGRVAFQAKDVDEKRITVEAERFDSGLYLIEAKDVNGKSYFGRITLQK